MNSENNNESRTKYIIETTDQEEMHEFIGAKKVILALRELMDFERELYNGHYQDVYYLTGGYKYEDFNDRKIIKLEDGKAMQVIHTDTLITEIDAILDGVREYLE